MQAKKTFKFNRELGRTAWHDADGNVCDEPKARPLQISTHVSNAQWPMHCEASAVHPKEAQMFNSASRDAGVATEHDQAGRPVFTSRRHRAKYLKWRGFYDKTGGYAETY